MEVNIHLQHNSTYNITAYDISSNRSVSNEPSELGPTLYMYVYVSTINLLVFFVGVVGNALVIQVVARVRAMRKRMNYFLVSLSVADLLVLLVGLPAALHEFFGKEKWFIGEAMCKIVPFLENASHHCSVLTLLAIGFERYYAICHPLRETVGSRVASTSVLIPAVWVVSCLVSVPFAIISNIKVSTYYDDTLVNTCRTDMSSKLSRAYIIFISVAFLALPLLLLTALYSAIIRTLRASTKLTPESTFSSSNNNSTLGRQCLQQNSIRNARAMASRRQVIRMMVGVMSLYFLCLFPLRCVQLWLVFGKEQDLVKLGFVGYLNLLNCVRILVYVNSAGNPIIYGLLSSNFREAFKQSCFKRRSSQINTGQHNRYYSSYNHHNPYRQPPETTVMTTHFGQEAAISTDIHMEENGKPTETNRSSRIVPSHPSRSNSVCSENCVDKLIAPLLNQAVSVDSDGVTPGYTQTKLGLAYI